jgi:hypothetical protein
VKRRLFTILSACSLLLLVPVFVLWVRSYWICDRIHHGTGVIAENAAARCFDRYLHSCRGVLHFGIVETYAVWGGIHNTEPQGWQYHSFQPTDDHSLLPQTTIPFRWVSEHRPVPGNGYHDVASLTFPHGALMLLLALLPACWMVARSRNRRRRRDGDVCPSCGYDLRATPDRCPECGTITGRRHA